MIDKVLFRGEQHGSEQGVLLDWAVEVGDVIGNGETLCTVETAAGTLEVPSTVDGQIVQLYFAPGEQILSGTPIALVGEPGEALEDDLSTPGVSLHTEDMMREELSLGRGRRGSAESRKKADYDLFVIGGGPAGYRAAIRAARAGARVALAEEHKLGGVCLNYGCIPAKSLIHTAHAYRTARDSGYLGVRSSEVTYSLARANKWKNESVDRMRTGIEAQLRRYDVHVLNGNARFHSYGTVTVNDAAYTATNILIATGGKLQSLDMDVSEAGIPVMGSTGAFNMTEIPRRMLIIGGGYIGLEIAGLYATLGSDVTVMESQSDVLNFAGGDMGRQMRLAMDTVTFMLNAQPTRIAGNTVYYKDATVETSLPTDCVVQVVGRTPRVEGLVEHGIELHGAGIAVDDRMRTNLEGVYAAGDVTGKLMLAHAAYRMADVAADSMFGNATERLDMNAMPWIVYTMPELAGCGLNATEAERAGIETRTSLLPLATNNRYFSEHADSRGWCRIVSEAEQGYVVGAFMMGHGVSELIGQASMAIANRLTLDEVARVVAPHPTLSEAFRDAADAASHISKAMAADQLGNPHL
ncbi:MAG: FAD-dependent oxidoreductase [Spirochaetales bacterium]